MQPSALKLKTCRSRDRRLAGSFLLHGTFLLIFLLFGSSKSFGQKRVTKTLLNPDVSAVNIDGNLCYRIVLETADTKEVSVEALMDGEYQKGLLVNFREAGKTLYLETRFSPDFQFPNDKLGAHKVVSVSMRVTVPRDKEILLTARSCQISASGKFRDLKIVFNDGFCDLSHTAEKTEVHTRSAPIVAYLSSGLVEAESRYGEVRLEQIPEGDHHLKLYSTRGNISVSRTP
jgi:hypothetical protein